MPAGPGLALLTLLTALQTSESKAWEVALTLGTLRERQGCLP